MEALEQHLFPPIARMIEEYNPPRSLLIITYNEIGYGVSRCDCPSMTLSEVVDKSWADTVLYVQGQYPDHIVEFGQCHRDYKVELRDLEIKVINEPELVDAFERTYGESYGSYPMNSLIEESLSKLQFQLTRPGVELEGNWEEIDRNDLTNFFLNR